MFLTILQDKGYRCIGYRKCYSWEPYCELGIWVVQPIKSVKCVSPLQNLT